MFDIIYLAGNPLITVISVHGLCIRLERAAVLAVGTLRILTEIPNDLAQGARLLIAPMVRALKFAPLDPPLGLSPTDHAFWCADWPPKPLG
ncbi:MAG: hypothetical protein ACI9O0_000637 [Paracoccaceae bacterium]|jgi:hypothetical protein